LSRKGHSDETADRERAVVDIVKLRDYCLSSTHLRGRHKARVFAAALGLAAADAEELRHALVEAAGNQDAVASDADQYGQRYVVDFTVKSGDRQAVVRSSWIVCAGEDFPRLTSCFVM
jgi:hypothetical protein